MECSRPGTAADYRVGRAAAVGIVVSPQRPSVCATAITRLEPPAVQNEPTTLRRIAERNGFRVASISSGTGRRFEVTDGVRGERILQVAPRVVWQRVGPGLVGLAAVGGGAAADGRTIPGLLFDVPSHPLTFVALGLLLLAAVKLVCITSARHAVRCFVSALRVE